MIQKNGRTLKILYNFVRYSEFHSKFLKPFWRGRNLTLKLCTWWRHIWHQEKNLGDTPQKVILFIELSLFSRVVEKPECGSRKLEFCYFCNKNRKLEVGSQLQNGSWKPEANLFCLHSPATSIFCSQRNLIKAIQSNRSRLKAKNHLASASSFQTYSASICNFFLKMTKLPSFSSSAALS